MSNDIKVGDLVYVARPTECCGNSDKIGFVFRIERILDDCGDCEFCGDHDPSELCAFPLGGCIGESVRTLEKFRDFPESELRDETRELEAQS